jgi:hypothetical protein
MPCKKPKLNNECSISHTETVNAKCYLNGHQPHDVAWPNNPLGVNVSINATMHFTYEGIISGLV